VSEEQYIVPRGLQQAIVTGQCVAFVGAGFVGDAVPTWPELLEELARRGEPSLLERVRELLEERTAFAFEAAAQILRDHFCEEGASWEGVVHDVLAEKSMPERAQERLALFREIPFRAVLTTNIDPILQGSELDPSIYASVLREDQTWWGRSDWASPHSPSRTPVVKLHGRADGQDGRPVVLARSDYRRRLYEDHGYANFLRAVFARYTLLFLGVSFTDAYLNELRSEVLSFIREPDDEDPPWGYAVMGRPTEATGLRQFMRAHEGIEVLMYCSAHDHSGFDRWLRAIADCTSATRRLDHLLGSQPVVWVDPERSSNSHGIRVLQGTSRRVELLQRPDQLTDAHVQASLLIVGGPDACAVLEQVRAWPVRPPVVVFGEHTAQERHEVLRRGAWEYVARWSELFEAIERLFGRDSPL
jgi:hypothetical protein